MYKNNFYCYANKSWMKNNKLSKDVHEISTFSYMEKYNSKIISEFINKMIESKKLKNVCILNKQYKNQNKNEYQYKNIKYLNTIKRKINNIESIQDMDDILFFFMSSNIHSLFTINIDIEMKNNNNYIIYLTQASLILPYLNLYKNKQKLKIYSEYITKLSNYYDLNLNVESIILFEIELIKYLYSNEYSRDIFQVYNKLPISFFSFIENKCNYCKYMIIDNPLYFSFLNDILYTHFNSNKKIIKNILLFFLFHDYEQKFRIIYSKKNKHIPFAFSKKNKKKLNSQEVIAFLLPELISKEYVQFFLQKKNKDTNIRKDICQIFNSLQLQCMQMIRDSVWMSNETKKKNILKLKKMQCNVIGPTLFDNYDTLYLNINHSFLQSIFNCIQYKSKKEFELLSQKVFKTNNWTGIFAHNINAFYHPILNQIYIPAAILQSPIYQIKKRKKNVAYIGTIIGHEMIHAFDDQGCFFNHNGLLMDKSYWNENDTSFYNREKKKLIDYFNNLGGNGNLTIGENISDLGGFILAYRSIIHEYNDKKKFFFYYSDLWKNKKKKEIKELLYHIDPHSQPIHRVNAILSHFDEFYDIFNITKKDKMYLAPKKRCKLFT